MSFKKNSKMKRKVYKKMTASELFQTTKEYHHRKLKIMFHRYYQIEKGPNWTVYLSTEMIRDLRLHLSWELGMNVFDYHSYPRYILGKMVLDRFQEIGILSYMLKSFEV